MALEVPNRLPVIHRQQNGSLQATSKPETAVSDRIFAGTVPPASERGCHEKCGCFNTQHIEPSGQWATPGR
jgi:hypothetical protein